MVQTDSHAGNLWFLPLFATPVFAIEVLVCIAFFGKRTRALFVVLVAILLGLTGGIFSHKGSVNHAIWAEPGGFILHDALRPKAVLPNTAVVQVKAAGLNPADYKLFSKLPSVPFVRWFVFHATAYDISGVVVELGPGCTKVKVGDAVFGQGMGAMQEYTLSLCNTLGHLPNSVSFVQGAAAPTVTFTAAVGLRKLKEQDVVLVVGSSGGCGQAALAFAKTRNVGKIYCVASGKNRAVSMAKGCNEFYDYTAPDFRSRIVNDLKGKIDLVFETVTDNNVFTPSPYINLLMPTLKDSGNYVALNFAADALRSENFKKFSTFVAIPSREEVDYISQHPELFKALDLAHVFHGLDVMNVYKAYDLLKSHRTVGKIVFTVGDQTR